MKKLIFFLALAAVCFTSYSQTRSTTLNQGTYYYEFALGARDTIIKSDTLIYQVLVNKPEPIRLQVQIDMDSISGSSHDSIFLEGKVFSGDSWSAIDTAVFAHTGTGLLTLQNITSDMYYRYYRLNIVSTSAAGKNKVAAIKVKIWKLH